MGNYHTCFRPCILHMFVLWVKVQYSINIYIYIILYLCTGLAQEPSQCMHTLRIETNREHWYIMPGVTNCVSCAVAGNVAWQITVDGIQVSASSSPIASTENNYLTIPSPESYVLPGQPGRRIIECNGASSLEARLASPSKMDRLIVILVT